jgi:hypothetical protein
MYSAVDDDSKYRYKFYKRTGEKYDLFGPKPRHIHQRPWNRWLGEKQRRKRDDEQVRGARGSQGRERSGMRS